MVFESVIADVLNIYLGDYVENLDRSQLQIGIWGGDVVLQDLVLKPNIFDGLNLPLKCTFGHLGRLVLKIPWKNLYSAPVVATVERLFILAVPDPNSGKYSSNDAKQAELLRVELARRLKKETEKSKTSDTFVEKLSTQIIKNIQIKIQDIHIRYEDAVTNAKYPFSLGVTLHNLSVQSTDKNWKEGIVQDQSSTFYKVLNLEGFAVYWNCRSVQFDHFGQRIDMLDLFQHGIFSKDKRPENYSYILGPINSSARLQLNPNPENNQSPFSVPKVLLTVLMDTLAVGISKEQYHCLVELLEFFEFNKKLVEYQQYKPSVPKKKGYYKEWWRFALNCIRRNRWRGIDWEEVKQHRSVCREYASVYMQKIQVSGTLPNEIQHAVDECESHLDVFNILRIRRQVEAELEWMNQKSPKETKPQGLSSWFGSWWVGADTAQNNQLTDKFIHELTAEERLKLYQAIDYEENAAPALYPEDFVERQVIFHLGKLTVEVSDKDSRVVLANLSGVFTSLEQRPSANAFRVTLKMTDLSAWGSGDENASPQLVKSLTFRGDGSESVLMKLMLETNPLDQKCGRRLHILSSPMQLIYDANTAIRLASIFTGPQPDVLIQLQAAAGAQLSEMSALGLQYAIKHHVMTEVDIDMKASHVLVPYKGRYSREAAPEDLLVINLGQLSVMTLPRDAASDPRQLYQKGLTRESIVATMREESYDRFRVELKNVQALLALAGEDWEEGLRNQQSGFMHLLKPISFSCLVEKCLVQNDPSLPNLKIAGKLSTVSFVIEDNRVIHLLQLYESIPFNSNQEDSNQEVIKIGPLPTNTLNDSVSSNSSLTTSESDPLPNSVKLDLNFSMEGVSMSLFKTPTARKHSGNVTPSKLLELKAMHLNLSLLQRSADMSVTACLGGVSLVYSGVEGSLFLLDPSSHDTSHNKNKDLLTIKYTSVDEVGGLEVVDKAIQQFLDADFSHLTLLLHHEALLVLMEYGQALILRLEAVSSSSRLSQTSIAAPKPVKMSGILQSSSNKRKNAGLKLCARLHLFSLSLLQRKKSLAHFTVEGMEAEAITDRLSTTISARLRNVCLLDPGTKTYHNKIVSIIGKEALSLEIIKYNETNKKSKHSTSMSITACLSRSRIVFLNSFTQTVLTFMSSFQKAQENIAQAVADAAEAAKQKVLHAHAESQFIVLNFSFQAPLILVPVNSTSLEVLQLDFGQLLVKNKLDMNSGAPTDVIKLDLQDLQVARVTLNRESKILHERKLVYPVTCSVKLLRSLSMTDKINMPEVVVNGQLDSLQADVNKDDVQMVMRIMAENLDSKKPDISADSNLSVVYEKTDAEYAESTFCWKLVLGMSVLQIRLGLDDDNQIDFAMTGSDFTVMKNRNMQVTFRIRDLIATNPFAPLTFRKVVTVEGDEAFFVDVVMYDAACKETDDITVKASMAQIHLVYSPSLMLSLKEFLQAFNYKPEVIVEAMQGVAEAAKEEVMEVHNQATRIGLNVDLKAPVIIIPYERVDNEALLLDFGNLTVKNKFEEAPNSDGVVIDDMLLSLQNLKMSRVRLGELGEVVTECWLLGPVNLFIKMKRNLNAQKYIGIPDLELKGHLKSVVVALNQNDIQMILGVLANFSASKPPTEPVTESPHTELRLTDPSQSSTPNVPMVFSFTMDRLIVELFNEKPNLVNTVASSTHLHAAESSLARCSLILFVVNGAISADGSLSTTLYLTDCQLDDSRPERQCCLTRLLESIREDGPESSSESKARSMEVSYVKKEHSTDVKIHLRSMNFVLSLEYLRQLGMFISKAFEQSDSSASEVKLTVSQINTLASPSVLATQATTSFSLFIHAEKPNVFLLEDMEDPKTISLVLKSDIKGALYQTANEVDVKGSVDGLEIFSCCYHPDLRKNSMSQILQPCSIKVEGTISHFEVQISDVRVRISPATINFLSRVTTAVLLREECAGDAHNVEINYKEIWVPRSLKNVDHWFLKTEIGEDALQMSTRAVNSSQGSPCEQPVREVCILKMPSLTITVEAGAGAFTLPMIMTTAGINAMALDWSTKLVVEGTVSLQMAYYNSHLALWEPLVEPVEALNKEGTLFKPWELMAKIEMDNTSLNTDGNASNQPSTSINIYSKDSLEITVTKTCLEVLSGLGQAFQIVGDEVHREGPPAPYHIINHTGTTFILILKAGPFKVYGQGNEKDASEYFLLPGESVALRVENEGNLSSPLSLLAQGQAQEKFLKIMVHELGDLVDLPLVQAGQRHFPLSCDGTLISDIRVESGSSIVTLRSMLQVYNNLGMPIDIHYQHGERGELKYVDTVPSGEHVDLPFCAIYTTTRELFFSVPGFVKVPYPWAKELSLKSSVLHECKSLQKSSKETVFFRILRNQHQAYSKATNTQGPKSIFYKLYIQPAGRLKNLLPVGMVVQLDNEIHALAPSERLNIANARPDRSKLYFLIPDYHDEEWDCWFDMNSENSEFSVLTFKNRSNKSLSIGAHTVYKSGIFIITLYSPYWMLNKTGLPLSYKLSDGSTKVVHYSGDAKAAVMFPSFSNNAKAAVQVADGNWSQCFSLDVAGSTGVVTCPALGQVYRIGVSIQLMRCTLTKQVTFTPHFVMINNFLHTIECQEAQRAADLWVKVDPGDCCSLWPVNVDNLVSLRARIMGTHQISVPFPCSVAHTTLLRLDNQWGGVNVDVQLTESSVYITFAGYEAGQAAALLVNHSDVNIPFAEKSPNATTRILNPFSELLFTWMKPDGLREVEFMLNTKTPIDKEVCQLRRDASGNITLQNNSLLFWSSFLDGAQRIILFSRDPAITQNVQEVGQGHIQKSIIVNLSGLGLSIVDNQEKIEVLYIGISRMPKKLRERYNKPSVASKQNTAGIWVQVNYLPHETQIHAKLDHIQADCQLPECTYPVAVAPVPPSRSVAVSNVARPFMEFSAIVRKAKHSSLLQVQYCKALVQAFHVKVDMALISALAALVEAGEASDEVEVAQFLEDFLLVKALLPAHVALGAARGQKHYFRLLHFSPLKIHLSLSLAGDGTRKGRAPPHALRVLLHSLGVTLTNAQDVVFRLAYFERQEVLLSAQQLTGQASDHYRSQVLKQLYVLVLGLDVLGNPLNFVKGLKQGVEDMFYEPIQGAIQGPEEFAQGLALGVKSLLGHTVGGAFGAASKITGAVGSGVAALTFDEDYKRKRQEAISNRPTSVTKGLAQSGEGVFKGVVDGVSGVFLKPISGAKKDGVEGFFKGFGKGVAGLVARPTAGIIDFASESFDALRRTTETTIEIEKLRPARFFRRDGRVRPYVHTEAEGHKILQEIENKAFAFSDMYDSHLHIESIGQSILMLTDKRVLCISRRDGDEIWKLDWQIPWEVLQTPVVMVDGIHFPKLSRSSGSRNPTGYKVVIRSTQTIKWIVDKIKILMKQ